MKLQEPAIILFDGVCNFCNGFVPFVIQRDPHARFRFAALQSDVGRRLLVEHGLAPDHTDSMVLIEAERVHLRSSAALRIARRLRFPWPLGFYLLIWVPAVIRDLIYTFIAQRRYRWFGKRDTCFIPTAEINSRFVTDLP